MLFSRNAKLTAMLGALIIALALVPAAQASGGVGVTAGLIPLLVPLQRQHAPGAQVVASASGGMLNEGQSSQVFVTLQPGKCYTGIGLSAPTISELVVDLTTAPPLPPLVLSQSAPGPLNTVMASQPNCFRSPTPFPFPALFRLSARKGAGPAVAQLYAK
jgi:hypothetical protein